MQVDALRTRNTALGIAIVAVASVLLTLWLPSFTLNRSVTYLYLLIELFTVFISLLVVVVSYHSLADRPYLAQANLLILGFTVVAICDLAHGLTYPGLPGYVMPDGTTRTIFFRLMGRSAEVLTLFAVACQIALPGSRARWLLAGIGLCGLIGWFGIFQIDLFPEVIRDGRQTPFKTAYEYTLATFNIGVAVALWQGAVKRQTPCFYLLSCACVLMAAGNVILAQYRSPLDFTYTFGLLFKVIAYTLVYRAAFVHAIKTPYHLMEERVAQRTAALTRANKQLEAFSYMVAHDLRAPVRHIDGHATLLQQDLNGQLPDENVAMLAAIRSSAATMRQMIDGILALSKLEVSRPNSRRIDLSELANQIGTELQASEPQRMVQLNIQPDLWITADPVLIKNVLANLMSNAWKFTVTTAAPHIEVGAHVVGKSAQGHAAEHSVFFVRDNGIGFAPQHAAQLFDLFVRLPSHSHVAGHGIGLASVRSIIENHGGKVWAEGAPGQGATFYFSVPAARRQSMQAAETITADTSTHTSP